MHAYIYSLSLVSVANSKQSSRSAVHCEPVWHISLLVCTADLSYMDFVAACAKQPSQTGSKRSERFRLSTTVDVEQEVEDFENNRSDEINTRWSTVYLAGLSKTPYQLTRKLSKLPDRSTPRSPETRPILAKSLSSIGK